MLAILLAALCLQDPPPGQAGRAADPAYAPDGRLAVSIDGDLWVRSAGDSARWFRLTAGLPMDLEPAWTADGSAIVFASDRSGTFGLWRVGVGAAGPAGEPEPLSGGTEPETEPTAGPAGDVVFVRGAGPQARLVRRAPDGAARPLTAGKNGAEHWPSFSPDGRRLAFVTADSRETALRIVWLDGDSTTVVLRRPAERPAWSPAGDRLMFASRGSAPGTWVTPVDGSYVNLVSSRAGAPAWAPDGKLLALAELPPSDAGYNGDPNRVGDRELAGDFPRPARLWFLAAPPPPDSALRTVAQPPQDRAASNGEAFDRLWGRTAKTYFSQSGDAPRFARWELLRATYRPRALAAPTDSALASVLHEMWGKRPPLRRPAAGQSAVSSASPLATAAGLEILRKGGNVVDAAVAVSFALGVVEPDASGIGGYGQMLVYRAGAAAPVLIEFMTRLPEEAGSANGTLSGTGYPDDGPVLANVPGTLAGVRLAWERYGSGKIAWADLVAPAIHAAEDGFPVSDGLATTLQTEREHFLKYPAGRALFFPAGEPLKAGETLRNPDLARTLRTIADSGPNVFYHGGIARQMVQDLRGQGNAIRLTDLARYYAAEREPVSGTYRGYSVFSSAPPSAGGATLIAQLNLLEQIPDPRPYPDDAPALHAMIEAWKLVPSARDRIADPGLWPVNLTAFVSKDSARARWRCFHADRALSPQDLSADTLACARSTGGGAAPPGEGCTPKAGPHCHRSGTTAFAVADAQGNVVAATQTLGTWGGNFYVTPGLGFVYNDKLGSYGDDPAGYGARLPNARHGSSLAPTIVLAGSGSSRRAVLGAGAAGNAWITSAVYAIVTGVIDQHLDLQHAIELPRFLLSGRRGPPRTAAGYPVQVESGLAPEVLRRLILMGDDPQPISLPGELRMGYAAAVAVGKGIVWAAADPRRSGAAGAIGCGKSEAESCQVDGYPQE